jgi:mannosidase alpha-like ER degradation enhancer 2
MPLIHIAIVSLGKTWKRIFFFFFFFFFFFPDSGFYKDELKPISCKGHNLLGGVSTTLIDSLDMLAILGDSQGFTEGIEWILRNMRNFDIDSNVSVFETNIRVLGGLLSAHLIAGNATLRMFRGVYDGGLLGLAVDLADRLLVAFDTPTRLPFGTVNLRRGVPKGESRVVCAACAAPFSLEFGLLSVLTGNPVYEATAKEAAEKLWSKRGATLGLLSTHLEIDNGAWVLQTTAGLGGDIDSAYEYFYKAGVAFNDERYLHMFNESFASIQKSLRVEGDDYLYYVDSDLVSGVKILNLRSLAAFWPGILAQVGKVEGNITFFFFFFVLIFFFCGERCEQDDSFSCSDCSIVGIFTGKHLCDVSSSWRKGFFF